MYFNKILVMDIKVRPLYVYYVTIITSYRKEFII